MQISPPPSYGAFGEDLSFSSLLPATEPQSTAVAFSPQIIKTALLQGTLHDFVGSKIQVKIGPEKISFIGTLNKNMQLIHNGTIQLDLNVPEYQDLSIEITALPETNPAALKVYDRIMNKLHKFEEVRPALSLQTIKDVLKFLMNQPHFKPRTFIKSFNRMDRINSDENYAEIKHIANKQGIDISAINLKINAAKRQYMDDNRSSRPHKKQAISSSDSEEEKN